MKGSAVKINIIVMVLVILSFVSLWLLPSSALAVDYYWVGGTGSWEDPNNWTPGVPQYSGYPYPNIYLTQSDATSRTVNLSTSAGGPFQIYLDATGTGTMTLSISVGGGLSGQGIGIGVDGTGIVNQTGGNVTSWERWGLHLGVNLGSSGIYNMSGGGLSAIGTLEVGGQGTGVINQTGGNVNVHDFGMTVSALSTYNLSGTGVLHIHDDALGGEKINGTFNQSGGAHSLLGNPLTISGGTYNLSNGQVYARSFPSHGFTTWTYIQNNGTFNQSGGNFLFHGLQIGDTTSDSSRFNLSGGILQAYEIVNNGTFTYSGGDLNVVPTDSPYVTNALTNNSTTVLTGSGTRTIEGSVINNGTSEATNTAAKFEGEYINEGSYVSDSYVTYFNELSINEGYMLGEEKDLWFVRGALSGIFTEGNTVTNIYGIEGMRMYYVPYLAENEYLGGLTYNLSGGGQLIPLSLPPLDIEVKPGNDLNRINLKSKGVVSVAVLTTDHFDALDVEPWTVLFAGAEPRQWTIEDIDGDDDLDLLFHIETEQLNLDENSRNAVLTCENYDGIPMQGADRVDIVPKLK